MSGNVDIIRRDRLMLGQLKRFAEPIGVKVELKSDGHFHIQGALLVNYYPFAKKRTAYVANTTKSMHDVAIKQAVMLAQKLPDLVEDFKRKSYRKEKLRMLAKHPFCKWCGVALTDDTATVDHVIPLSRGGLENSNNRVLACQPCNCKRGNEMPEIKDKP